MDIFTEHRAALIAAIEANPKSFDMGNWFQKTDCGTTACAAGTAAMLAGWKPLDMDLIEVGDATCFVWKYDARSNARSVAMEYLGLNGDQAHLIFVWSSRWVKTATELRDYMAHVVAEHGHGTRDDGDPCSECDAQAAAAQLVPLT